MLRVPDRLIWSIWRRRRVAASIADFWASPLSYCCPRTRFTAHHSIKRHTELYEVSVGAFSYFAENARARRVNIGPFCSMGPGIIVGELAKHPLDNVSTHPAFYANSSVANAFDEFPSTVIGGDVFIGARAMVFPGICIGHGAVVAAGAIVTRDVAPYAIVAGAPARVLRFRFEQDVVRSLTSLEWWTWSVDRLHRWKNFWTTRRDVTCESIATYEELQREQG